MHAIEGSGNVPAFLTKLWRLVDDAKTNDLISWTQNGRSFIIQNQAKFARELLPQYYKHNNMASFVRQLNMYGFHKVVSADSGGLRVERDEMEFAHQHFLRGQESLIENIKRKRRLASDGVDFSQIPTSRTVIIEENKSVKKLLNDVRDMKRDQDTVSAKLLTLKRENEALWREYANMRQKFSKQQQIIEKLIHFLLAMVKSPSKTMIPKRKFGHLALEGGEESSSSSTKLNSLSQFTQGSPIDVSFSQIVGECEGGTVGGAQIQEVTDLVDGEDPQSFTNVFLNDENSSENDTVFPEADTNAGIQVSEFIKDRLEPETILTVNGEPFNFIETSQDPLGTAAVTKSTTATSVTSPGGTNMAQNFEHPNSSPLLDEAPLSPELLNTVDPSAVTQSYVYAPSVTPVVNSSTSSGVKTTKGPSTSTSVSSQVNTVAQKGKMKSIKSEKGTTQAPTMSVAVPDKGIQNRQDLQTHMDDMQNTIDSLQDFLSTGNFNVDPSMLLTMFGPDDYMPELDSMTSVTSGNELSVYNPSLLDLAGDMEDDDPMSFLNSGLTSTSAASTVVSSSTSTSSSTLPSNTSVGPTPPKQLRLSIKKEHNDDGSLDTPTVLSPVSAPVYRGKRRTN
ncbi:heat shock factor protein isoform X3 [Cherax quadricarinatus]|uniref:heat shock factor protein isoform X3 n=1 Tax=Cherax quadricarinatus TaxID=27406 RepID=UPI00237833AF|nr:heat shock factor protein-like isoform X3 [Cherax quadricarinatus]